MTTSVIVYCKDICLAVRMSRDLKNKQCMAVFDLKMDRFHVSVYINGISHLHHVYHHCCHFIQSKASKMQEAESAIIKLASGKVHSVMFS